MGTYGSILSKAAISHGRDKGIPDGRKRWVREMIIENQVKIRDILNIERRDKRWQEVNILMMD